MAARSNRMTRNPRRGTDGTVVVRDDLHAMIAGWADLWNVPRLEQRVSIEFSRRLTASIGRYDLRRKTIRLAHWLLDHGQHLLGEVLCHEAAHAAAYEIHGRRCRPHGNQWKTLMRAAGFEPRVSFPERELPVTRTGRKRSPGVWLHRCPVCDAERATRRRMTAWRCMRCMKSGLDGKLEISRLDRPPR